MDLRQLRYFMAVAEELSFTKAATRLHLSQPPISRAIKQLEEDVGVALLERSKQYVRLTAAGAHFYEEARVVVAAAANAISSTKRVAEGRAGKLTIGIGGTAAYVLPELLSTFRQRFPDVQLILSPLNLAYHQTALSEGKIDVGLVVLPIDNPALQVRLFCRMRLLVAMPAEHKLVSKRVVSLTELSEEPFVLVPLARGRGFGRLIMACCRRAGFVPHIVQEAEPMEVVVGMVGAGAGIAVVPQAMQSAGLPKVVFRPLKEKYAEARIALAWRKERPSPTVAALLSCCSGS
jgi:DNA-binding transcriptional LysR family regulator